jgi:hypothetical protein
MPSSPAVSQATFQIRYNAMHYIKRLQFVYTGIKE